MSSVPSNEFAETFWIHCPSDILIQIFKRLDVKSLINCIRVTKSWSDTVHYYCQHYNIWGKMLEESVNKKVMTYEEKSNLNKQDLFLSATHWVNIQNPKIALHHEYNVKHIRKISVLKGMLIVTSYTALNFFDIKTMKILKTYKKNCLNYVETSILIAELTLPNFYENGYKVLTLTNKLHNIVCECTEERKIIRYDISIFKVHFNACYVVDIMNVLWVYIANECEWDCKALARYYGNKESMTTIHINNDDVYILLKSGDILKADLKCKKFERLYHLVTPLYYYFDKQAFMFYKHSVIIKVPNDKTYDIYPQKEREQIVMACPGLTCSLEHGPVVITGFENGKIEVFSTDHLVNDNPSPVLDFYLQSYVNLHSFSIKSIDVYEDTDGHHMYIATVNNIYELLIS